MVELLIDNMPAVLSDEFKATMTVENPFLTDQGEYANNIVLSLLIPQNARLYKYLNRPTAKQIDKGSRTARLVIDNKTVALGSEIIIENTDTTVEIQIVSGMSDIKFLIGEDKKLRELDLGVCEGFVNHSGDAFQQEVKMHTNLGYPKREWQPAPFERAESDNIGNYFLMRSYNGGTAQATYEGTASDVIPQPYFNFILERVFKALGYKLERNVIADTEPYDQAIIVHGVETMEYALMMPQWTVKEFFDEVSMLFGCTFLVDGINKTVQIAYQHELETRDGRQKTVATLEVLDDYKRTPDEDQRLHIRNSNIEYELGSEEYYQYACVLDTLRTARATYYAFYDYKDRHDFLDSLLPEDYEKVKRSFIKFQDSDTLFAYNDANGMVKVDSFAPIFNNAESRDIDRSLKIIPAAMASSVQWLDGGKNHGYYIQYPIAGVDDYPEKYSERDLIEAIKENIDDTSDKLSYDVMRLAIFAGPEPLTWFAEDEDEVGVYPMSYVEDLAEHNTHVWDGDRYYGQKGINPFRLSFLNETIYKHNIEVDTTLEHVFKFDKPRNFDIRSVFNIRNKEYLCAKIETEVTADGYDTFTTGYFYPRLTK